MISGARVRWSIFGCRSPLKWSVLEYQNQKSLYATDRAALPLVHKAGEAQADFGSAEFYLNGKLYEGNYLNVSFPYSNAGYLQLFKGESAECLFEGLMTIFVRLGGIPPRIWFDNASTLVAAKPCSSTSAWARSRIRSRVALPSRGTSPA